MPYMFVRATVEDYATFRDVFDDALRIVHVKCLDDLRRRADHADVVGVAAGTDAVVRALAHFFGGDLAPLGGFLEQVGGYGRRRLEAAGAEVP